MKNIVFDYGNVLVRWEPERVYARHFGSEAQAWAFMRHVCTPEWRMRIDCGESQAACLAELKAQFPDQADAIELYRSQWEAMLPGEVPGMYQLVAQLKGTPGIALYGLTNWSMETFPAARRRFDVLQLIDRYVVSGDVHLVKPNPAIFNLLTQRYGIDPAQTVFVDDNEANVEAALALGFNALRFVSAQQLRQQLNTLWGLNLQ